MRIKRLNLILLPGVLFFALQAPVAGQENTSTISNKKVVEAAGIADSSAELSLSDTSVKDSVAKQSDVDDVRSQLLVTQEFYDRVLDRTVARSNRWLTISGNISSRYSYITRAALPDSNTFSLPTASLSFKGTLFRDFQTAKNLTYALGFSSSGGAAPTVTDASLTYVLLSNIDLRDPGLNVSLGQQKKPFGAEAQSTDETSPSVAGSLYLSGLLSDVSQRDIGLVIKGDILPVVDYGYNYRAPFLAYNLALFNGTGPNTADNNSNKEFVGRLVFSPSVNYYNPLRGLTVGGSYATSKKFQTTTSTYVKSHAKTIKVKTLSTGADSVLTYTISPAVTTTAIDTLQGDRTRYGIDVSYIRTPVNLTVEGVFGTDEITNTANKATDTAALFTHTRRNYAGASVTLFLNIGQQFLKGYREQSRPDDWWPFTWQPFFRIDGYDADRDVDGIIYKLDGKTIDKDGRWQAVGTVGANLFFARTSKLQINFRVKKAQGDPDGEYKNNEILAQFGYGF
jgi:hypothetical protein